MSGTPRLRSNGPGQNRTVGYTDALGTRDSDKPPVNPDCGRHDNMNLYSPKNRSDTKTQQYKHKYKQ